MLRGPSELPRASFSKTHVLVVTYSRYMAVSIQAELRGLRFWWNFLSVKPRTGASRSIIIQITNKLGLSLPRAFS